MGQAESVRDGRAIRNWATEGRYEDVLRALRKRGVNPDAPDADLRTPLHHAASKGNFIICGLLIGSGAKINTQTQTSGWTALHLAAANGSQFTVQILLAADAKVNLIDCFGHTPLHFAAVSGHRNIVRELIAHGAAISPRNAMGETPAQWALRNGKLDLSRWLDEEADGFQQWSRRGWVVLLRALLETRRAFVPTPAGVKANGTVLSAAAEMDSTPRCAVAAVVRIAHMPQNCFSHVVSFL